MDATFDLSVSDPCPVLSVRGVLDAGARDPLAQALADLDATGAGALHLDLAGVLHVDSGCLRVVDDALAQAAARGAEVTVTASAVFVLMSRVGGRTALVTLAERGRPG